MVRCEDKKSFQRKIDDNGLLDVLAARVRDYFGQVLKGLSKENLAHLLIGLCGGLDVRRYGLWLWLFQTHCGTKRRPTCSAPCTADIRYQLASIPSKTSIGMAQLLPFRELRFNNGSIGKVVRKGLTYKVKGNAVVPTYVLEYLLGQFCVMLANNKDPEDEAHLEVISWNTPEHMSASIAAFEEFQESVSGLGIHLGRGLDIFEKNEGRFNAAELDQNRRKCKACEINYLRVGVGNFNR